MSCFGGNKELLYLLKLTVETVKLSQDKILDFGNGSLVVKIKLIDFPIFEISRQDFYFIKPRPLNQDGTLEFFMGKCCLFSKQPRDLMQMIKSTPMKIGLFCAGDSFPIAETEISLSGCLCDQVTMALNDSNHLPTPYVVKGGFHLRDPGNNSSGAVKIHLKLKCLGKTFTTQYKLCPKSFIFQCQDENNKYYVKQVLPQGTGLSDLMKFDANLTASIQEECYANEKKKSEAMHNTKKGLKKDKKRKNNLSKH